MKIAVSSSDGVHIDTHFGKASTFYIFEKIESTFELLEKRETEKYCSDDPEHSFRPIDFDKVYQSLADCEVLYTKQIGKIPAEKLRTLGIEVKEVEGKIESNIEK